MVANDRSTRQYTLKLELNEFLKSVLHNSQVQQMDDRRELQSTNCRRLTWFVEENRNKILVRNLSYIANIT